MLLELQVTPLSWPPKRNFLKHIISHEVPRLQDDMFLKIKLQKIQ
jgi:hypothetical protein